MIATLTNIITKKSFLELEKDSTIKFTRVEFTEIIAKTGIKLLIFYFCKEL